MSQVSLHHVVDAYRKTRKDGPPEQILQAQAELGKLLEQASVEAHQVEQHWGCQHGVDLKTRLEGEDRYE
jgi:hypothetical protein